METQGGYVTRLEELVGKGEGRRESFHGNNITLYGFLLSQSYSITIVYLFRTKRHYVGRRCWFIICINVGF